MRAKRQPVPIDWDMVDNMLRADCEGTEVAARLGMHPDTLYKRCRTERHTDFAEYLRLKKSDGNSILKERQYALANANDRTMLIWLGKQRLNQREKIDHGIDAKKPLQVVVSDNTGAAAVAGLAAVLSPETTGSE